MSPKPEFLVFRVIGYDGPSGTYCAPRSRFLLSRHGIEKPDAECILLEFLDGEGWFEFEYDGGRYRGRLVTPDLSFRAYARKFLHDELNVLLSDISSL